ncbi:hypothetical protein DAEQUDRAFT_770850 [Daedalea quercina L-15889]|uniref:Fungal-type protein kinase domain-containing protein n=1 Tax=Daedalea quercina L-15889 TaxID=1314783 RepID=A0A165KIB3_9APHY|nr:hypothetical protein DAEQUDRAFT_770850 [Daedalea quercina L-15889]
MVTNSRTISTTPSIGRGGCTRAGLNIPWPESWDRYAETGAGIPREDSADGATAKGIEPMRPLIGINDGSSTTCSPPIPIVNRKGELEWFVDDVLRVAECKVGRRKMYLVKCRERTTGTFYFMAMNVLMQYKKPVHQVNHDLESTFWLLIWLVLRYTKHTHPDVSSLLIKPFDHENKGGCAAQKLMFLVLPESDELGATARQVYSPLTYERVLEVFDEALQREDWPVGDKAIPFVPAPDPSLLHRARPQADIPTKREIVMDAIASRAGTSKLPFRLGPAPLPLPPRPFSDGALDILQKRYPDTAPGILINALREVSGSDAADDLTGPTDPVE